MKKVILSLVLIVFFLVACKANENSNVSENLEEANTKESNVNEEVYSGKAVDDINNREDVNKQEIDKEEVEEETVTKETNADKSNTENTENTDKERDKNSNLQDYIDLELVDMNGESVRISDYEGKFIVLNFFGVWCHYCMEEMPDLEKVYSEYEGDDFVILLINATTTEKIGKDEVIDWYKEENLTMPMALDIDGLALATYPVSGFPTSYFISKEGKVLGAIPGMLDEATLLGILSDYNK